MDKNELFRHLDENTKVLRNPEVRDAFGAVDRADFVGEDYQPEAYEDYAVPIGHGQSISKPTVAAFMLELLGAGKGDRVLEIGSGSGWVTALLAHIVGDEGSVTGIEKVSELVETGRTNLSKYDFEHATVNEAGTELGLAENGPYDRIFCSAGADEVPQELVDQLAEGGVLVMPVSGTICRVTKDEIGSLDEEMFPGSFEFAPLE